ncbi:17833_t:CDS:2 [Funneliformis geosporum]|uniref:17833_t:CDS:1 n=1 Tax=Funneliformis geosporum TaxID=1117311 RepID=A0A9W4SBA2_9GLOM|nr:17833_t:CDS:2 [Funneliformis geosporum]
MPRNHSQTCALVKEFNNYNLTDEENMAIKGLLAYFNSFKTLKEYLGNDKDISQIDQTGFYHANRSLSDQEKQEVEVGIKEHSAKLANKKKPEKNPNSSNCCEKCGASCLVKSKGANTIQRTKFVKHSTDFTQKEGLKQEVLRLRELTREMEGRLSDPNLSPQQRQQVNYLQTIQRNTLQRAEQNYQNKYGNLDEKPTNYLPYILGGVGIFAIHKDKDDIPKSQVDLPNANQLGIKRENNNQNMNNQNNLKIIEFIETREALTEAR